MIRRGASALCPLRRDTCPRDYPFRGAIRRGNTPPLLPSGEERRRLLPRFFAFRNEPRKLRCLSYDRDARHGLNTVLPQKGILPRRGEKPVIGGGKSHPSSPQCGSHPPVDDGWIRQAAEARPRPSPYFFFIPWCGGVTQQGISRTVLRPTPYLFFDAADRGCLPGRFGCAKNDRLSVNVLPSRLNCIYIRVFSLVNGVQVCYYSLN